MAVGTGTKLGIFGAVFHIFNHAIFKSLLFTNAAAVETETGSRDMDKMAGFGARMPVTATTSILGSLSAAGIPPLAGFWSKLIMVVALWKSGHPGYAVIAILASILTLAYLLSMQRRVFFGKIKEEFVNIHEAGFGLSLPVVLLSIIIVAVGISFPFVPPLKNILEGIK
jgi:multicomponent Na+:H+ antiporter subunit D